MKHNRLTEYEAVQLLAAEILTTAHPQLLQRRTDWNTDGLVGSSTTKELTEHDREMLRRAEEKRERKAAKRVPQ